MEFFMKHLILLALVFILAPLIDYLWLNKIMSGFYLSELGTLARAKDGEFNPKLGPAMIVYVCIAVGIVYFVLPKITSDTLMQAALWGAVFGFVLYGLYDMTNLALVQNWPIKMSFVDMAWGTFLCSFCTIVAKFVELKLNS